MKQQRTFTFWIVLFLLMFLIVRVMEDPKARQEQISYGQFMEEVAENKVESVTIRGGDEIIGTFKDGVQTSNGQKTFKTTIHPNIISDTAKKLEKHSITPNYRPKEKQGFFSTLLLNWGPMILIIVIFYLFLRQIQAGGGKAMSFGKSRARMLSPSDKKVSFKDVAGVEEAKEELVEIVDFLKDPKKYTALGGKIPKGVILVGPPGTGKTLLARAVAGEADVPFFSISGSDFVEMFVGVGASRVRDLFEQGKKNAPCIIFIDEIDAVGRHRGAGLGGGHDEREQTLNQLLVEMDGFESNEGVILIAATNRIDVLDPALLRPGRFDRRVVVDRPDIRGRHGILKVHTGKTPLDKTVELEVIAKGTPGFTGADLANLVNEAALIAARANKKLLFMRDFEEAKDKVLMGVARKSMVISDKEKRNTAYHEAGHTLVGMHLPQTDPIHKVTIIPRGGALGVTQTLPEEDSLSLTKEKAENFIAFLMGGRVAEEMTFGDYTNGASNDIERATELATKMVTVWGMSEAVGPIKLGPGQEQPFQGMGRGDGPHLSDETSKLVDGEISRVVKDGYETAKRILHEYRDSLKNIAEALIIWETLDAKQIEEIVAGKDIGVPTLDFNDEDGGDQGQSEPKEAPSEQSAGGKEGGDDPMGDPVPTS